MVLVTANSTKTHSNTHSHTNKSTYSYISSRHVSVMDRTLQHTSRCRSATLTDSARNVTRPHNTFPKHHWRMFRCLMMACGARLVNGPNRAQSLAEALVETMMFQKARYILGGDFGKVEPASFRSLRFVVLNRLVVRVVNCVDFCCSIA